MRVMEKATKKVYRFNCPICGSKLEADGREFSDLGNKVIEFNCPVCRKRRYINWGSIRCKIIYEGEETRE